MTLLEDGHN